MRTHPLREAYGSFEDWVRSIQGEIGRHRCDICKRNDILVPYYTDIVRCRGIATTWPSVCSGCLSFVLAFAHAENPTSYGTFFFKWYWNKNIGDSVKTLRDGETLKASERFPWLDKYMEVWENLQPEYSSAGIGAKKYVQS